MCLVKKSHDLHKDCCLQCSSHLHHHIWLRNMGPIPTSYQATGVLHTRRLQLILGLRLWHKVTHSEIRSRAGIPSIESMLLHHQLRWLGHVIRIPHNRLPHCVLNGKLQQGRRSVGGQNKRFKDHIKLILKSCNIPFSRLETLASEIATWRSTCAFGLSYFDDEYDRAAALRRSRRHQHAPVLCPIPDSVYQCPLCGRQCYSRIGLLSHSKTHIQR